MSKDYDVGRGRPPRHAQFKRGQSGNPKGRPKGSTSVASVLAKILGEKIPVMEGGKKKHLALLEAMLRQQVIKAMKGDTKAFKETMALAKYLCIALPDPEPEKQKLPSVLVVPETLPMERWMEVYGKPMQKKLDDVPVSTEGPRLAPPGPPAVRRR